MQDHKTRYLPYSKSMCLWISQAETLYGCIMGIFGIFLFFSQIDFLLIRALAELSVNHYTTNMFMEPKEVDRGGYEAEKRGGSERMDESKLLDRHHGPGDDMGS